MKQKAARRVNIPQGTFGDLVDRGRSFFSPAQLKFALTQVDWAALEQAGDGPWET